MVGTFKANNPVNTFVLFIYGLFLKFSYFSYLPIPAANKADGFLFHEILLTLQKISAGGPFIYSIITYLLLFTQAVSFNRILNDQKLLQQPTYLPAMSYLLITSVIPEWNILSGALLVNTILIWVWRKINTLYNTSNPKTVLFNIGIAIGIASFLYVPAIAFLLLIIFSLIITRPFKPAEWFVMLAGIILPFYYFFAWLFLSDNLKNFKQPVFVLSYPQLHHNYWLLCAISIMLIMFLTGAYYVQLNSRKQLVQIRKSWSLLFIYLLLCLLIPFINDTHSFEYWILAAVPLSSFIGSAFFYLSKKWILLLLHWSMVALAIVISYYYK